MQSESGNQLTLPRYPKHWLIGQLLDVVSSGGIYRIILNGEDWRYATAMQFDSTAACQDFVSWWYARGNGRPDRYMPEEIPTAAVQQKRTIKLARPNVSNR